MKYLKKRKMYKLAKRLCPDFKISSLFDCSYRFGNGTEWFSFNVFSSRIVASVSICCFCYGQHLSIEEKDVDGNVLDRKVIYDVSGLLEGL